MELRVDLPDRYREAAAEMYARGDLRQVNGILANIGIHVSFSMSFEPKKADRPETVAIYAEDRREW